MPTGAIPLSPMDDQAPVNVTRLQIPIGVMITILVFMLGGVVSMTMVWAKTTDPLRHVDPEKATEGGGVAYKNEVKAVQVAERHSTRKMLLGLKMRCTKQDGNLECQVSYIPETE